MRGIIIAAIAALLASPAAAAVVDYAIVFHDNDDLLNGIQTPAGAGTIAIDFDDAADPVKAFDVTLYGETLAGGPIAYGSNGAFLGAFPGGPFLYVSLLPAFLPELGSNTPSYNFHLANGSILPGSYALVAAPLPAAFWIFAAGLAALARRKVKRLFGVVSWANAAVFRCATFVRNRCFFGCGTAAKSLIL